MTMNHAPARTSTGLAADGTYQVGNHTVTVTSVGTCEAGAPLVYWIMMPRNGDESDALARLVQARTNRAFTLVACEVNNWDRELSPWPAGNITGDDDFTGQAPELLAWLREECIPFVEGDAESARARCIGGYSMGGLFSCWAFLSCDDFAGLASGSGSLWFPGWTDWANGRHAPADSIAYLSLGTKEPHVRNKQVATVGDATQMLADALATDGRVSKSTFVWNPGGHFNQPSERMADAFSWVVERL